MLGLHPSETFAFYFKFDSPPTPQFHELRFNDLLFHIAPVLALPGSPLLVSGRDF